MAERDAADLAGVEVALTGRCASMTHAELGRLIEAAGGRHAALPGPETGLLVVGRGGVPLGQDGRLTASLRRAHRLAASGARIEIVGEERLLARLGRDDLGADLTRLYTTAQIARILDVPAARIRAWTRAGLIVPVKRVGRLCWFEFGQVSSARTLVRLAERGVTPGRLRKSLAELDAWLHHEGTGLSQLEALEGGGALLVRLADGRLAEPSGQLRLAFERDPAPAPTHHILTLTDPPAAHPAQALGEAARLFERGVRAEERGQLVEATLAYERCLAVGGPDAEACFNLGNTLYALGRHEESARRYAEATGLEPDFAEAWNNLGNVLCELGRADEGISAYHRALALAADYADVHYNLAETLAAQGQLDGACHHWRAYLACDPHGDSALRVREQLAKHDPATPEPLTPP